MHVADPRVADVPLEMREALAASDIAVFELPDDGTADTAVRQATLYGDGRRLTDLMTDEGSGRSACSCCSRCRSTRPASS